MTSSKLHTISRRAAKILNRRGYEVVWSISLQERDSPETFICTRGAEDTLHVKLKLCPNMVTTGMEVVKYCDDEIRILRRLMKDSPRKTGEHFEVWVVMARGGHYAVEVLPDMFIDMRSGAVISPQSVGGVTS